QHPAFAARAFVRKLALFWNDFEVSDNQDQYLLARESWVLRLPLPGFGAVFPFALLGAVVGRGRRRDVRLLVALVLVYCASAVGRHDRAIAALEEAVATCPLRCRGALADLADEYARTGRASDGAAFFRRFVRDHPEHPDGTDHLARLEAAARAR